MRSENNETTDAQLGTVSTSMDCVEGAEGNQEKQQNHQGGEFHLHDSKSVSNCSICIDFPTNICSVNSCNHTFCLKCIKDWAAKENTCPLCRKRFTRIKALGGNDTDNLFGEEKVENRDQSFDPESSLHQQLLLEFWQHRSRRILERIERDMEHLREERRAMRQMHAEEIDDLIQNLLDDIDPTSVTNLASETETGVPQGRNYNESPNFFGRVRSILQFNFRTNRSILSNNQLESLPSNPSGTRNIVEGGNRERIERLSQLLFQWVAEESNQSS